MLLIFYEVIKFLFRVIFIKAIIVCVWALMVLSFIPVLFFLIKECCDISRGKIDMLFAALPPEVWYFLDWLQIPYALSILIPTVFVAFMLSILPFVNVK